MMTATTQKKRIHPLLREQRSAQLRGRSRIHEKGDTEKPRCVRKHDAFRGRPDGGM